jgi:hypothetical protein
MMVISADRCLHFFKLSPGAGLDTQEEWMTNIAEDFGENGKIMGWYRGPSPAIYCSNADFIKEILIKESETFIDRPMLDRTDNIPHLILLKGNSNQLAGQVNYSHFHMTFKK